MIRQIWARLWPLFSRFTTSSDYWKKRYQFGGNSGFGSRNQFAEYKAKVVNHILEAHNIQDAIEFGCGDGHQLGMIRYQQYLGLDISPDAVKLCREAYGDDPGKRFQLLDDYDGAPAEITVSMDVIYHLVEDEIFESHMAALFNHATRFVLIYSSNCSSGAAIQLPHVRHRIFSEWIDKHQPTWKRQALDVQQIASAPPYDSKTRAEFFLFENDR